MTIRILDISLRSLPHLLSFVSSHKDEVSMADARIYDDGGPYILVRAPRSSQSPVPNSAARSMVARWLHDGMKRGSFRRIVWSSGQAPFAVAVADDELQHYVLAQIAAGRLFVCRDEGGRARPMASLDPSAVTEADDSDEGERLVSQVEPCDFDRVVIKCKHMPDPDPWGTRKMAEGAQFWWERGSAKNNLQQREGRAFSRAIEVVAGSVRDEDDISISLEGGPGYTCSRNHPRITVKEQRGGKPEVFEGKTSVQFKALSRELLPIVGNPPGFKLLSFFFFPDAASNTYIVDVEACGCRDDGSQPVGRSGHEIKVRPVDIYKLSLSLPALKKTTRERSAGLTKDFDTVRAETSIVEDGLARTKTETHHTTKEPLFSNKVISSHLEKEEGTHPLEDTAKSFKFERNGEDIKGTAAIGEFIYKLREAEKKIKAVSDFIRDFQPQVGWKFVYELELFKGDLSCEWGFKEWEDHTVYRWWKLEAAMTLMALKLELRFGAGFRVCRFEIQCFVFGNVSLDAKLKVSREASAGDPNPFEATISSEPKGEIGIRSKLGEDWAHAEGKFVVSMNFEAKVKISTTVPFHIDWRIDFGGVNGQVVGHVKWVGSLERSWPVVDKKKPLTYGRIPEMKKIAPPAA